MLWKGSLIRGWPYEKNFLMKTLKTFYKYKKVMLKIYIQKGS